MIHSRDEVEFGLSAEQGIDDERVVVVWPVRMFLFSSLSFAFYRLTTETVDGMFIVFR